MLAAEKQSGTRGRRLQLFLCILIFVDVVIHEGINFSWFVHFFGSQCCVHWLLHEGPMPSPPSRVGHLTNPLYVSAVCNFRTFVRKKKTVTSVVLDAFQAKLWPTLRRAEGIFYTTNSSHRLPLLYHNQITTPILLRPTLRCWNKNYGMKKEVFAVLPHKYTRTLSISV